MDCNHPKLTYLGKQYLNNNQSYFRLYNCRLCGSTISEESIKSRKECIMYYVLKQEYIDHEDCLGYDCITYWSDGYIQVESFRKFGNTPCYI